MKMKSTSVLLLVCAALASADSAAESPVFVASAVTGPLVEQFQSESWADSWIVSQAKKEPAEGIPEDALRYKGVFAVEEPSVWPGIKGDKGLVMKTASAHHAISHIFKTPIDPAGKDLVIQYEVKFQKNHECGGAYLKLLTFDAKFDPAQFQEKSPYTIMFGPDKCGSENKLHFIFRHTNKLSGKVEEKHMMPRPEAIFDKKSGLYTLVVRPDNTFEVFVNAKSVKSGSLLKDFEPSVNGDKEIDDPSDVKPSNWVEEKTISDPEAVKPDDWDEDAPAQIEDDNAVQPEDWFVDEPALIPDPAAETPVDWDTEEDGDFIAPSIPNPKCKTGCGEWKRPMIKNPNYKGKWIAPKIPNPDYKGVWAPRKIPNPHYYEDASPSDFTKIGAIGFELWTIQSDVLFDNIYVGHSLEDANKLAKETWEIKYKKESEYESAKKAEEAAEKKSSEELEDSLMDKVREYVIKFQDQVQKFIARAQEEPVEAVKEFPEVVSALVTLLLLLIVPTLSLFGGSAKKTQTSSKREEKSKSETDDKTAGKPSKTESEKESPKKSAKASPKKE